MPATIVPCEGTTLSYGTTKTGTYTLLGTEVTNITMPTVKVTPVDTHGITSTYKTRRAGKILDSDNAGFKFYVDPNFADHAAIQTAALASTTLWWKVEFPNDNKTTTHATFLFPGFIENFKFTDIGEDANLENDLDINVTDLFEFTAGT